MDPHPRTWRRAAPVDHPSHPQPTHLWLRGGWLEAERCCHLATQQQLVHLRGLQHHQLQQV